MLTADGDAMTVIDAVCEWAGVGIDHSIVDMRTSAWTQNTHRAILV